MKTHSTFYPPASGEQLRSNAARDPAVAAVVRALVEAARPWREMPDDQLWALMFGATIPRSWMVWSNGYCPACHNPVPMYEWQIDALEQPWKVRCPHCQEFFPKNDFAAYYRSGMDGRGVFDPLLADRSLLFNAEHPDPKNPRHDFGVDDGWGYVDEAGQKWRFIGAYLIYGQWKGAVLGGIKALAQAYVATGEAVYAHKAAILLDRVADLYPTFDFASQAVVYETPGLAGYVSTWHDACEETRELALAYDMIFAGLSGYAELVDFLSAQAHRCGLDNPKATWEDIQRNIEGGILRDVLANPSKIRSNFPRQEIALITARLILGYPSNRPEALEMLDQVLQKATAVDGVTGEKGLAAYSAYVIQGLAAFFAQWNRVEPGFLGMTLARHPGLYQTYRFHIDTWCLRKYYPLVGDAGSFRKGAPRLIDHYLGVLLERLDETSPSGRAAILNPSMFSFLWDLYLLTKDEAFVQAIYRGNGDSVDGLPHDLFAADSEAVRQGVRQVIAEAGALPRLASLNKPSWGLALLRSGAGQDERVAWLYYGVGGNHAHPDCMNLGLFAFERDVLMDFGYPPVQFGGWESPRSLWYRSTSSHNTVVVDGQDQRIGAGRATLWHVGEHFQAVRAAGHPVEGGPHRFERTVVLVDLPSPAGFYLLDVFRVAGGRDHAFFLHANTGSLRTSGLRLAPGGDYGYGSTQMRAFRQDPQPSPSWWVEWQLDNRNGWYPPTPLPVHLRYTGLATEAAVAVCEGWISPGNNSQEDEWIPRLLVRRQGDELSSVFVGVIEPYAGTRALARIRRLPLTGVDGQAAPEGALAVEVCHVGGGCDLLILADLEEAQRGPLSQPGWNVVFGGDLCLVRRSLDGSLSQESVAAYQT